MELILAGILAAWLLFSLADDGWLGQDQERVWINYLADRSRRTRSHRRARYVRAGWRPTK